jgi:hypothetical protein
MITIDIDKPKSCQDCLLSCVIPALPPTGNGTFELPYTGQAYHILCRADMNIHNGPSDETCPIQDKE